MAAKYFVVDDGSWINYGYYFSYDFNIIYIIYYWYYYLINISKKLQNFNFFVGFGFLLNFQRKKKLTNRETVEAIGKSFPSANWKSSPALVIKSVYSVDWGTLVVPPQQEKILGVFNLEEVECLTPLPKDQHLPCRLKAGKCSRGIVCPCPHSRQEEIVGLRWKTSIFK